MKTRQRRTARLMVLVGVVTALLASAIAVRWWIRWPEDVAERLSTLVSAGEFEKANRLLAAPAEFVDIAAQGQLTDSVRDAGTSRPTRKRLRGGFGESIDLTVEEWKKLFAPQKFTPRPRTSDDHLKARGVLEAEAGDLRRPIPFGLVGSRPAPVRVVLTIERGTVSVRLIREPVLIEYE